MKPTRWTLGLCSLGCFLALLPTQPMRIVDLPGSSKSDGARRLVAATEAQVEMTPAPCGSRGPAESGGERRCRTTNVDPWRLGEIVGGLVQELAEQGSRVWVETDVWSPSEWLANPRFARIAHVVDGTLVEVWLRTDAPGVSRPIEIVTRAAPRTISPYLLAPPN